ncbi:hypothetical protein [Candidatus Leptofilum sp.]|uniref:hypothetical protein n=1 Tax=Candidatus Leptofilum sp. TaxID=3241576 RepID=UPI003B5B185C
MDDVQNSHEARTEIFQLMRKHLSLEDIKSICFMLGNNYDDLSGDGLSGKVRELILNAERQGQLKNLIATLSKYRPHVIWPGLEAEEHQETISPELSSREIELIVRGLNLAKTTNETLSSSIAEVITELATKLTAAVPHAKYPNIAGKWAGYVDDVVLEIEIFQNDTSVHLQGEMQDEEDSDYNFEGDGYLISNILIYHWKEASGNYGINVMTVAPEAEVAEVIEGKYFNYILGGIGNDVYERMLD